MSRQTEGKTFRIKENTETVYRIRVNDWNPALHPRDEEGKFTEKGGSVAGVVDEYLSNTQEISIGGETVSASPVLRKAYSNDTTELKQAAIAQLDDSFIQESTYGPDRHGAYSEFNAWREEQSHSLLNDNTSELWGAAIDHTGNDRIPEDHTTTPRTVGEPLPAVEGKTPTTALGDSVKTTQEILRDIFGDKIPVVRGVNGDFAEQLKKSSNNGESVTLEHRALESWSTFPEHAQQFAQDGDGEGVLITTEIPVERVYGASHTTPGLHEEENEIIAALDSEVEYSPEQIHPATESGLKEVYGKLAS